MTTQSTPFRLGRRRFLSGLSLGAIWMTMPGAGEELTRTPPDGRAVLSRQVALDTDNDLLVINDGITPAVETLPG
jgi:protocatechuate 3,4-dioxygenase beta subunit